MRRILLSLLFVIFSLAPVLAETQREYNVGETAEIKDVHVTLASFRPHKESNRFMNKEGLRFYAVKLSVLNGRREPYEYNAYQFVVLDKNEEEYQWCISSIEPKFEGKILEPGMMGDGFLVFGLPVGKKPMKLIFDPGYISDDVVTFNLL